MGGIALADLNDRTAACLQAGYTDALNQIVHHSPATYSITHLFPVAALQKWVWLLDACSPDLVHLLRELGKLCLG